MKIVTIARSLNEEKHIADFCQGYGAISDMVLIADGGSTDWTVKIARSFPAVKVRQFTEWIELPNGLFMNPEPAHLNFVLDWAEVEESPDWIIMDDIDCRPNPALKKVGRALIEKATELNCDAILLYRYYLWDSGSYFPKINIPGPALWAWRPDRVDQHRDTSGTHFFDVPAPAVDLKRCFTIEPPCVVLHDFRPVKKLGWYAAWGRELTPIEQSIYWPPEPLPVWALEERWQS